MERYWILNNWFYYRVDLKIFVAKMANFLRKTFLEQIALKMFFSVEYSKKILLMNRK